MIIMHRIKTGLSAPPNPVISHGMPIPSLFFEPGYSLDAALLKENNNQDDASRDKLATWTSVIQKRWDTRENILLESMITLLKKSVIRRELTVCTFLGDLPSMSYPLAVNASPFLSGKRPEFYFFGTLHHELLHRYLNEYFSDELFRSRVLRTYIDRREPRAVISHLHLFAAQKVIYENLGREGELANIIQWNGEADDPAYARAWDIVNRIEGVKPFWRDLTQS